MLINFFKYFSQDKGRLFIENYQLFEEHICDINCFGVPTSRKSSLPNNFENVFKKTVTIFFSDLSHSLNNIQILHKRHSFNIQYAGHR